MKNTSVNNVANKGGRLHHAHIQYLAIELIERGARSACIRQLLPQGPNDHELASLQKQIHGKNVSKMAGRLPESSASIFKAPKQRVEATVALLLYQSYSLTRPSTSDYLPGLNRHVIIDPLALCLAYDECREQAIESLTDMWFLARDAFVKTISLRYCEDCHSNHIFFNQLDPSTKQNSCPHCQLQKAHQMTR